MDTIRVAAASVTGSRHLRAQRNGQDAAASWLGDDAAAVVVCDGCSAGASSEVGARLGAALVVRALATRLATGEPAGSPAMWAAVRADVVCALERLVASIDGDRAAAIHEHFLFTVVAATVTRTEAAVWALGDGSYALGDSVRVLGPFADNQPPYLAYDLLGKVYAAHLDVAPRCDVVIATDGVLDLDAPLTSFSRLISHPDALRRHLAVLARGSERVCWDERRIARTPAALQDDCAIGVIRV
jgi:hypothetical protein